MRPLTLSSALAICALTLAAPAPGRAEKPAAPPRELSKADAEWVTKKYAEAVTFGRAGKWGYDEAQGPVREILALCTRVLGEGHFTTADYRREIEALKKLAALPEAGRVEYMKTYTLYDEMDDLRKQERYADALRPAEQILDIYRRLLGPESFYVAMAANRYGQLLHHGERYAEAEKQLREALKVFRGVVGEDHPVVADVYGYLALALEKQGHDAESRRLYEAALKTTIRLRGEGHAWTGVAYNNLAGHLERQALFSDAERLYRREVEILRAAGDDYSTLLATAYNNLALNLQHQGKYGEAESLYQEALTIRRRLGGEDHPDMGRLYMNLASNREAQGDIAAAEPLLRKALDSYRKGYGPTHSETAWALTNLAVNLDNQGRAAEAEPLLRDALAIVLRAPGDQSRAVAKMSNNLASCLRAQDKYSEAEALCAKALSMLRDRLGADHPDVAAVLNNVAATLEDQDRYVDAERHFREALAIMTRRLGVDHPESALGRVNLGVNLYHQGRYDEADRHFREALAAYRRVLGEGHPRTAWAYKNLVVNCCVRGDYTQAAALADAAANSFETARRRISFAGLGRADPTAAYSPFPALAVVAARAGKPDAAWQALERDLARGLFDDLSRPLSAEDRRREQELLGRLDLLDRQVAALPAGPGAGAGGPTAGELRRQRDAAQAELARFQADLAARYGVAAGAVYDLPRIQARLREDAALLAWVHLSDQAKRADPKGDHWACVVRHRGAPVWVRLRGSGPDGAWTDEDGELAPRVLRALANRPTDAAGQWQDLARQFARLRLAPLEGVLNGGDGLPAVRHLIVLPCPKVADVLVEAVTDKLTVSYAPSGTLFAWLQEQRARRAAPAASLLALGDPTFPPPRDDGGPPAKAGAPGAGGRRETFARLPGTRQELLGVARVFSETRLLMGDQASGRNLDELAAAGGLRRYRYLHFATHCVLDDQRPMNSALILARDQPIDPRQPAPNGIDVHDGRLTAERILRGWKLDADLVTLSACDTGLGRLSGGEGYLGFSQALFLAGARGLVLSLWQVDDAATALLMTRFYENLLGTPEGTVKPMPKAQALAEAKRWLRGLGPEDVRQLTKDLPTRGTRGRVEPRKEGADAKAPRSYDHPYYWSGFILIGDPR
jgi:CHAT domain-containing protein/tetratricopeptide (TPR) repeat protein